MFIAMPDLSVDTLFYPFQKNLLRFEPDARTVFFNARHHADLDAYLPVKKGAPPFLYQPWKAWAKELEAKGRGVTDVLPQEKECYDNALLLLPKNKIESAYLIAKTLETLKPGGRLIAAAANDAGGKSLQKTLHMAGLKSLCQMSKHKARVVWGVKPDRDVNAAWIAAALHKGDVQRNAAGFLSQPGMFAWDRIDAGSALLAETLPSSLAGVGADFGCGYGFLSLHILRTCENMSRLVCIDADARAVRLCRDNLADYAGRTEFHWGNLAEDPARPDSVLPAGRLDFVLMNPPFHQGKRLDLGAGQAFIAQAAHALRAGGHLWMVANTHLAYEKILENNFSRTEKILERSGFKIFRAVK